MIEFLEEDDKKALLVYNSLDFFKFSFGDNLSRQVYLIVFARLLALKHPEGIFFIKIFIMEFVILNFIYLFKNFFRRNLYIDIINNKIIINNTQEHIITNINFIIIKEVNVRGLSKGIFKTYILENNSERYELFTVYLETDKNEIKNLLERYGIKVIFEEYNLKIKNILEKNLEKNKEKYELHYEYKENNIVITRTSKINFFSKNKFFIFFLCSIFIYLKFFIKKNSLDYTFFINIILQLMCILFPLFLLKIRRLSKEVMVIENEKIVIKNYFSFICYSKKIIYLKNIKEIYYENIDYNTDDTILFLDEIKFLKIKVKTSRKYRDKIYSFGIELDKDEFKTLVELFFSRYRCKFWKN